MILDGRVLAVYRAGAGTIGFEFDVPASPAPDCIPPERDVTRIVVLGRAHPSS